MRSKPSPKAQPDLCDMPRCELAVEVPLGEQLTCLVQCLLHDNPATQELQPFSVPPHLDFVTRRCKRKECLNPSDPQRLAVFGSRAAEQAEDETVERVLEMLCDLPGVYRVVLRLVRIALAHDGRILDYQRTLFQTGCESRVRLGQSVQLIRWPYMSPLHLVEHRVVRSIYLVSAVHVGGQKPAI